MNAFDIDRAILELRRSRNRAYLVAAIFAAASVALWWWTR